MILRHTPSHIHFFNSFLLFSLTGFLKVKLSDEKGQTCQRPDKDCQTALQRLAVFDNAFSPHPGQP